MGNRTATPIVITAFTLSVCPVYQSAVNAYPPISSQQKLLYSYEGVLKANDTVQLANFSKAGLSGDASQVNTMIANLQHPPHPSYVPVTMLSLSRLGAIQALPVMNTLANDKPDMKAIQARAEMRGLPVYSAKLNISYQATVAISRLYAEYHSHVAKTPMQQANIKVNQFYAHLGLSPDMLNEGALAELSPVRDGEGRLLFTTGRRMPTVGVLAMQALADMIYHGSYNDYASIPNVKQVNFTLCYPAALKMRLAPLSQKQKLATLIQELSHKTVLTSNDDFEMQLAINEGLPASQAAAAELLKMEVNRAAYNQANAHTGFAALFEVIRGVGDTQQAPLIKHFMSDPDPSVAYYADQVYQDVLHGIRRDKVLAY